ncbi:MAG: major capsid protein [Microvirus sp.]|nr:MAG: major capsid protein [Microvirus sp.]
MSQNKNIFNDVASPGVKKSWFDMSNTHVTSFNFGEIIPVYVEPTLPGSVWKLSSEWLVKTAATLAPIMHRNQVYIHNFFVPYRILWENWVNFITETKVGGVLPAVPYITFDDGDGEGLNQVTRLANYMGIPFVSTLQPGQADGSKAQAFWFAAYQKIWNEYYRDQNLQGEMDTELLDGDNSTLWVDLMILKQRNWMHDYFTSALPDTQKGDSVNIPMTFEDVKVKRDRDPAVSGATTNWNVTTPAGDGVIIENESTPLSADLYADTSVLTGNASIIDLRTAEQLQKFRETMMTHGSRYNEFLKAIYGYAIKDDTVQRPVYLGGMRGDLIVSETLNTAGNADLNLPQGNKSGNLNSYSNGGNSSYMCPEHGVIMSLMSVMPDSMYFQGIRKEFLKLDDPFSFGNPLMANIGEQPIARHELFAFQGGANTTFGYQMRYAEYKQTMNRLSADMTGNLLFWNMARRFTAAPPLTDSFIRCDSANDDLNRIFNVEDDSAQKLWVMVRTNANVLNPLPYFGTPMLGG